MLLYLDVYWSSEIHKEVEDEMSLSFGLVGLLMGAL